MNSSISRFKRLHPVALIAAIMLLPQLSLAQISPTSAPAASPAGGNSDRSSSPAKLDVVIVTGARAEGRTVDNSPAPIDVLSDNSLGSANQTNLLDTLNSLLPSFNAPNVQTPDVPSMIRAGELRDLPADSTLVLINGKRRHPSGFLQTSGMFAGEAPVDLSLIPEGSIANIEVLRDGASAIYGSDAIAGVINIITKNNDSGGEVSFKSGKFYGGDGLTRVGIANEGFSVGTGGYINVTAEVDDRQAVIRNFPIPSTYLLYFPLNAQGQQVKTGSNYSLPAGDTPSPQEATRNNHAWINTGSAAYRLDSLALDFGDHITPDVEFYGFGTYGYRTSSSAQNFRQPARLEDVLSIYPNGFTPYEAIQENDAELTAGFKGKSLLGWDWDLSSTVAQDNVKVNTLHSVSPTYGNLSPTNFYDGANFYESVSENLDLHRKVDLASFPVDLSAGAETRYEEFKINPGDLASWSYDGQNPAIVTQLVYPQVGPFSLTGANPTALPLSDAGAQALPGFRPQDAVDANRTEAAAYVGASTHFTPDWVVDLAGRYEDYSDAGDTVTGRLSSRYDFSRYFGLRATVSNGFHAPALAVDNYRNTANINTYEQHTLAVNSPQAKALGAKSLVPEKSVNTSAGIVSKPASNFSIALDAYQINFKNLITSSSSIRDTDAAGHPTVAGTAADALVTADGFASGDGVSYFINACNTRTQGLELTLEETTRTSSLGDFIWTVAASANRTVITGVDFTTPAVLQATGISLFNPASQSSITFPSPRRKVILGADWQKDKWDFAVHETYYSIINRIGTVTTAATSGPYAGLTSIPEPIKPLWVTDVELSYRYSKAWSISLNVNNVFDVYPTQIPQPLVAVNATGAYPNFGPVGALGGFYSATVKYKF
jgi:iron complex outermembrane receptor protein